MNNISVHPDQWPVGTSTSLFPGGLTPDTLLQARDAGIKSLELVVRANDPEGEARYDALAPQIADYGMDVWSAHLPFGKDRDISSTDPAIRRLWIDENTRIMERAVTWGAKKAILHPSYEPIPSDERPQRLQHSLQSLQVLGQRAADMGIQIAVECLPRTCLGNTATETLQLIEAHPGLGICCDVNHLLQETPQAFIDAVAPHIVTLHISDYDGNDEKHWLPGRGVIDWPAVLAALVRANYSGPFMFEVSGRPAADGTVVDPQTLVDCFEALKTAYNA